MEEHILLDISQETFLIFYIFGLCDSNLQIDINSW